MPSALALFAHPDDIEFVAAGTLLLLKERGWDIHYMNMCTGNGGSVQMDGPTTAHKRLEEGREAARILAERAPDLEVDGEMQADTALSDIIRERVLPHSRLKSEANVLIMPNLDAANIAYQLTKVLADALPVGPILLGTAFPAHILPPSTTARGVVNMTALAVVEAQARKA